VKKQLNIETPITLKDMGYEEDGRNVKKPQKHISQHVTTTNLFKNRLRLQKRESDMGKLNCQFQQLDQVYTTENSERSFQHIKARIVKVNHMLSVSP
jgi:hypothetical protein